MKHYLIILEDETIHTNGLEEGDLQVADDGLCSIIGITTPEQPIAYHDGGWTILNTFND